MFDNHRRRGEQESTKKLLEKPEREGVEYETKEVEGAEEAERYWKGRRSCLPVASPCRGRRLKISSSVSKRNVVVGEEAGSKLEKAKKLGVTIINEDAFREMVGEI